MSTTAERPRVAAAGMPRGPFGGGSPAADRSSGAAQYTAGYAPTLHSGWYLAAVLDELTEPITPLRIGSRRLMIVDRGTGPHVYDAVCPHRGADLGIGGRLTRAGVVCPFHGKAVALGDRDGARYRVGELASFQAGGMLFVSLSREPDDHGLRSAMSALATTHLLFACPPADMPVPQELVVENAFDLDHFIEVHRIPKVSGIGFGRTTEGAAWCEARFAVRTPAWDGGVDRVIRNRFYARAFSPSVVLSELGAAGAGQTVITTATPVAGGCRVRVINAIRPGADGTVAAASVRALTDGAAKALQQDLPVWANLTLDMQPLFDPRDDAVLVFREFCGSFATVGAGRVRC